MLNLLTSEAPLSDADRLHLWRARLVNTCREFVIQAPDNGTQATPRDPITLRMIQRVRRIRYGLMG